MSLFPEPQQYRPTIGYPPVQYTQTQTAGQQGAMAQFQQILNQLEQTESRHAQMLHQIQVDEQHAAQQIAHLRQLSQQIVPQAQPQFQSTSFSR